MNQIQIEYRKSKMEKTQVMKLNTSKDNVEAFFDKIKTKLTEVQSKPDNTENFDITMIVNHESKNSFKSQQKPNQQPLTVKSILSQNDPNVQGFTHKKTKPKILNQDNQVQSRMLNTELSISREDSQQQNAIKSNKDSYASGKKLRQSNKMPQIRSMFRFQKKAKLQNQSHSNNKVPHSQQIPEEPYHKVHFPQDKNNQNPPSPSSDTSSEPSQQQQQLEQQNLKQNISRKQIDIFPNIEITSAVSDQLYSLRTVTHLKPNHNNNNKHKRRCSIADESLLSPKTVKMAQEIERRSAKRIVEELKGRVGGQKQQKSLKKLFEKEDCINQMTNSHGEHSSDDNESLQQRKSMDEKNTREFIGSQAQDSLSKPVITPKSIPSTRERQKALVKKSIFDPEHQNHKRFHSNMSSEPNSCQRVKASSHLQIQPHPQNFVSPLQEEEESSATLESSRSSSSSNEEPEDSIYVIQNKLNDCIRLLQKNQLSTLQNYLYEFKDKYFYVSNTRIQIKWRLLMAHCKENKKEFERAAINYNNVIDLAKENPKSLTIEPAEVYHRLGVCYGEIGWWNKGIVAFAEALNRYKRGKNVVKYAECMNNLGTLYLQASSLSLAEKCFIQSYDLKKSLHGKSSTKLLTSLFNIFECNLLTKNYDQAQKVITVIEQQIISIIPQSEPTKHLYLGGLYRRKGKMEFLRGNNKLSERYYLMAFERLSGKYPYCMEFGELMACLGLLKLEDGKYKEAKQYYDKAIMLMNFYCSKDSVTILTLKKNLQYSVKMIKQQREGSSSKRSAN